MSTTLEFAERLRVVPAATASPRTYGSGPVWAYSPRSMGDEARQVNRRPLCCSMMLVEPGADPSDPSAAVPGACLNVCDGGLYGTVPLGYGVGMGQHYVFRLMIAERGPEPGNIQTVQQEGRVIRTELLVSRDGSDDRLGIAVRLFGHRTGMLPLPG